MAFLKEILDRDRAAPAFRAGAWGNRRAPQADRLSFEIDLGDRAAGTKKARCRTVAEGRFAAVEFSRVLPPRFMTDDHALGVSDGWPAADRSLTSFVAILSVGIRAHAHAAGIAIRSLEVEATFVEAPAGARRQSDQLAVAVEADADAGLPALETLVSNVSRWVLAPAVTEFADRLVFSVRKI